HLSFFNSNPFVATLGLGALTRIEADARTAGGSPSNEMIERFSVRLSTPLGAVGDELFWAAIRPQMSFLAVLIAIFADVWGAIVFVVGFSIIQYAVRWWLFRRGWELGTRVVEALRDGKTRRLARSSGLIAATCAGAVLVAVVFRMQAFVGDIADAMAIAVFLLATVTGFIIVRVRKSAVLALVIGLAWVGLLSLGAEMFSRFG
ncbi:MAG TPA: hypothetical protein ENN56_03775, partial [Firmicutes bacterium]|nr:hypothetical protein [Bacillota bacterium]